MTQESFLKIVLVGDSGVGKSTIAARFCGGKFNPVYVQTREKDIKSKEIILEDKRKARLQIWDTPGGEAFRTITAAYINKDIKGVIVVFDVTCEESFDNVQHWMRTVQEFSSSESLSIAIVGNKTDKNRKVTQESGEKLACNKYNVRYFETSASAKSSENIETVFREITLDVIRKSESLRRGVLSPPTPDPGLVKQEGRKWCTVL